MRGAGYIELREHVDLSTIQPVVVPSSTPNTNPDPSYVLLGEFPKAVLSIQVCAPGFRSIFNTCIHRWHVSYPLGSA